MRRLLLASLAFLLTFLPMQVGVVQAPAESCCAACQGMPSCPPKCPAPPLTPVPLAPSVATASASDVTREAEAARPQEPSPFPGVMAAGFAEPKPLSAGWEAPRATGPPDRADRQAFLSLFRI